MSLKWLITLKTLAVKENNMSSKFSTPFLKKSPLFGAYENAADGQAFMGGLVTGQEQFAKLQDDILTGLGPKQDTCSKLLGRRNKGTITQSAYEAASKDCGKEDKSTENVEVPDSEIDTEKYQSDDFVGDFLQEQSDEAFNNNPYYTGQTPYRGLDQYNINN
jgi:hypothetical protein